MHGILFGCRVNNSNERNSYQCLADIQESLIIQRFLVRVCCCWFFSRARALIIATFAQTLLKLGSLSLKRSLYDSREIHSLTCEFHTTFHWKSDIARRDSCDIGFCMKFHMEYPRLVMSFLQITRRKGWRSKFQLYNLFMVSNSHYQPSW